MMTYVLFSYSENKTRIIKCLTLFAFKVLTKYFN